MKAIYIIPILCVALSCKKDEPATPVPAKSNLKVYVQNIVDAVELHQHGTKLHKYLSPANDTFTVSQFKYYISNIKLINGNTSYVESNSYHLLGYENGNNIKEYFEMKDITEGEYSKIQFSIGVDSTSNHRTDFIGDLDPNNNMAWDWNTGYKFVVLEGNFTSVNTTGGIVFHIGEDANYKTVTFDLPTPIKIKTGGTPSIILVANVNGMFRSPQLIDFDIQKGAMMGPPAKKIADNYAFGMFTVTGITN